MTSRSDGNSDEMSCVSLSRWRDDMRGKGAESSRPKMERMSWRMVSTPSPSRPGVCVAGEPCSRSRAGMLFWPR